MKMKQLIDLKSAAVLIDVLLGFRWNSENSTRYLLTYIPVATSQPRYR